MTPPVNASFSHASTTSAKAREGLYTQPRYLAASEGANPLDVKTASTLQSRLQGELYGVRWLHGAKCSATHSKGWIALYEVDLNGHWYCGAMHVVFPATEADMLVQRLVAEKKKRRIGWRPSVSEIIAAACALPAGRPQGRTEEILRGVNLWRERAPISVEDATEQDKFNTGVALRESRSRIWGLK
jgi:hypothetical protein